MLQKSGEKTTWDGAKTPVNNEINHQPQLVIAGFLNHQQYLGCVNPAVSSKKPRQFDRFVASLDQFAKLAKTASLRKFTNTNATNGPTYWQ